MYIHPDYRKTAVEPENLDKQFTYYTIKVLENIVYDSSTRYSMMGKPSRIRSILEDVRQSSLYPYLPLSDLAFWEVYYRHNNYFLEKNSSLLNKIKNNKNFVQASIMNNSSIGFEQFIEFYD